MDKIEDSGRRSLTAVRIEPNLYDVPLHEMERIGARPVQALTPVFAEFLDLPLLRGDESPHAPYVAVVKTPWAGPVAVYSSADDYGYAFVRELMRPATVGELVDPLPRGVEGLWSQARVRVRIQSGVLQRRGAGEVLNGANVAALRFGGAGDWEIVQFAEASRDASGDYVLSGLLRGQAGTDGVMPDVWPSGTDFVLLDSAVAQLDAPSDMRGLERHFRIGPSVRAYDDESYVHIVHKPDPVGLRPYRPAHLALRRGAGEDVLLIWARRARIDGDSWEGRDVPLSEEREAYQVRVMAGGAVIRDVTTDAPRWTYSLEDQIEDGMRAERIEVAQTSDRYGPGPYASIIVAE